MANPDAAIVIAWYFAVITFSSFAPSLLAGTCRDAARPLRLEQPMREHPELDIGSPSEREAGYVGCGAVGADVYVLGSEGRAASNSQPEVRSRQRIPRTERGEHRQAQ